MRQFISLRISTAIALIAALFVISPAKAQNAVADFYKGKTVTIFVGVAAGGVYSQFAQLLATHLGKHIPGNPNVIVQHQVGAGGLIAINHVYNVAPKDGTVVLTPNSGLAKRFILGEGNTLYEPAKFHWLGGWGEAVNDCTVFKTAPATTLEEARTKEIVIGAIDTGSNTYTNPLLMNNLLGTKFKIVPGYGGGSQIRLAMERGEVHGLCGQFEGWKTAKPEWLAEGKLAHLVQLSTKRSADMPNTPLLSEFARNDEEKQILTFVQSGIEDRAFVAPPGVPADRLAALAKAYEDTIKDPKFVEETSRSKFDVTYVTGKEIQDFVESMMKMKPESVEKLKKATGRT
jgi:tripartite-type tricarboxylate transporter receptor subunit TctC